MIKKLICFFKEHNWVMEILEITIGGKTIKINCPECVRCHKKIDLRLEFRGCSFGNIEKFKKE